MSDDYIGVWQHDGRTADAAMDGAAPVSTAVTSTAGVAAPEVAPVVPSSAALEVAVYLNVLAISLLVHRKLWSQVSAGPSLQYFIRRL